MGGTLESWTHQPGLTHKICIDVPVAERSSELIHRLGPYPSMDNSMSMRGYRHYIPTDVTMSSVSRKTISLKVAPGEFSCPPPLIDVEVCSASFDACDDRKQFGRKLSPNVEAVNEGDVGASKESGDRSSIGVQSSVEMGELMASKADTDEFKLSEIQKSNDVRSFARNSIGDINEVLRPKNKLSLYVEKNCSPKPSVHHLSWQRPVRPNFLHDSIPECLNEGAYNDVPDNGGAATGQQVAPKSREMRGKAASERLTSTVKALSGSCRRVLLVDAARADRRMLCRCLRDMIETVQEASDGHEAIDIVRSSMQDPSSSQPLDAVVIDYVLLGMTGPVVTSNLRDLGYNGVIVGVIGYYLPVDVKTFIASGADKVITKPVDVSHLTAIIQGKFRIAEHR